MNDITEKQTSLRRALAQGRVKCDPDVMRVVRSGNLPKGDLFHTARAAGFLAVKQTQFLIPHCHPVSIDGTKLDFELEEDGILISCEVQSICRTGVEMEALTAVSVAGLVIYDLLKPLKGDLTITDVRLAEKKGGRSDFRKKYSGKGMRAAVLVCSDSTAAGKREDRSGRVIQEILKEYETELFAYEILPDDPEPIQKKIREWAAEGVDFVFTTGGTGLGPRDRTIEALREILDREAPGITEAMRSFGQERTPVAMLSRSIAGVLDRTIIVSLPGSSNGARESLRGVLPALFHGQGMVRGGGH